MSTIYIDREPRRQRATPRDTASKGKGGKWSNQHKRERNVYPGQGTAPLSSEQKAAIAIAAARAFSYHHAREPISAAERDLWRRAEQQKAVDRPSLTVCTQAHYLPLLAHFQALAGETGAAYQAHIRDATAPHRVALHKLAEICAARGVDLPYAAVICRSKFKCTLDEATDKQLWCVYFDLKGRPPKKAQNVSHKVTKDTKGREEDGKQEADIPF